MSWKACDLPSETLLGVLMALLEFEGLASEPERAARDAECVIMRNCNGTVNRT